jgi:hypothetical protein
MVSVKSPLAIRLVNDYWQKKKIIYLWNPSFYSFYSWRCLPSGKTLVWQFFSSWQIVYVWHAFFFLDLRLMV